MPAPIFILDKTKFDEIDQLESRNITPLSKITTREYEYKDDLLDEETTDEVWKWLACRWDIINAICKEYKLDLEDFDDFRRQVVFCTNIQIILYKNIGINISGKEFDVNILKNPDGEENEYLICLGNDNYYYLIRFLVQNFLNCPEYFSFFKELLNSDDGDELKRILDEHGLDPDLIEEYSILKKPKIHKDVDSKTNSIRPPIEDERIEEPSRKKNPDKDTGNKKSPKKIFDDELTSNLQTANLAEEYVKKILENNIETSNVKIMPKNNKGYDIEYTKKGVVHFAEVKGIKGKWENYDIIFSKAQFEKAYCEGTKYSLFVVENVFDTSDYYLHTEINDPTQYLKKMHLSYDWKECGIAKTKT